MDERDAREIKAAIKGFLLREWHAYLLGIALVRLAKCARDCWRDIAGARS